MTRPDPRTATAVGPPATGAAPRTPGLVAVGALALTGLTGTALRRQAVVARRRYGQVPPDPGPVDLVVTPARGTTGPPLLLAALGDSGMAGVGAQSLHGTLPVQLARRLADATGRPVRVVSTARTGARTADVLSQQVPRLPAGPDAVVLMVGTNDVTHLTPWWALARSTAELLDALTATGAPVVVSSLPEVRALRAVPRPLRDAALLTAAGVGRVQRAAAARRPAVTLVDVRRAVGRMFLVREDVVSHDAFHPSDTGYGLIADALLPALVAALAPAHPADPALEGAS